MPATESVAASEPQGADGSAPALSSAEARLQRNLKIVVAGLAVLLFGGLLAVAGRVIYLASPSKTQPAEPTLAIRPQQGLALPAGAQMRSIALSGNRLAVHYEVDGRPGIAVFDIETGRTITDVAVQPGGKGGR
jgi:hypothetical protein